MAGYHSVLIYDKDKLLCFYGAYLYLSYIFAKYNYVLYILLRLNRNNGDYKILFIKNDVVLYVFLI